MKERCWSIKEKRPVPPSRIKIGTLQDKRVTIEYDPMLITYETFETLHRDFRMPDGTIHNGASFATYDYEDGSAMMMVKNLPEWLRHHKDIVGPAQ